MIKTKTPYKVLRISLTIQTDENGEIFDVNLSDGYKSISYDGEYLPPLEKIVKDFDY